MANGKMEEIKLSVAKINEERTLLANLIEEWQKRKNEPESLINQQYCIDSVDEQISLMNSILKSKINNHFDDQELLKLEEEINSTKQNCKLLKKKFLEQEAAHELELMELYEFEKELDNLCKRRQNKVDGKKVVNVKTSKVINDRKKNSSITDGIMVQVAVPVKNRNNPSQTRKKLNKQAKPSKKHRPQPTIFNINEQASPNIIITRNRAKIRNDLIKNSQKNVNISVDVRT